MRKKWAKLKDSLRVLCTTRSQQELTGPEQTTYGCSCDIGFRIKKDEKTTRRVPYPVDTSSSSFGFLLKSGTKRKTTTQ